MLKTLNYFDNRLTRKNVTNNFERKSQIENRRLQLLLYRMHIASSEIQNSLPTNKRIIYFNVTYNIIIYTAEIVIF
jgi:hypothetical protein